MNYSLTAFSCIGPRRANEDAVLAVQFSPEKIALAVADGLGGMGSGGKAAKIAIEGFAAAASNGIFSESQLLDVARQIHSRILHEQSASPSDSNMATTLTAAVINNSTLIGVHCGDTRLAIARAQGIVRLTEDHSEGMRLYKSGKLSKAEYFEYPRKHILDSALGGHKAPQIDTFSFDIEIMDKVVISSDGLHQKIPLRLLKSLLDENINVELFAREAQKLVEMQGPEDNYSLASAWCL